MFFVLFSLIEAADASFCFSTASEACPAGSLLITSENFSIWQNFLDKSAITFYIFNSTIDSQSQPLKFDLSIPNPNNTDFIFIGTKSLPNIYIHATNQLASQSSLTFRDLSLNFDVKTVTAPKIEFFNVNLSIETSVTLNTDALSGDPYSIIQFDLGKITLFSIHLLNLGSKNVSINIPESETTFLNIKEFKASYTIYVYYDGLYIIHQDTKAQLYIKTYGRNIVPTITNNGKDCKLTLYWLSSVGVSFLKRLKIIVGQYSWLSLPQQFYKPTTLPILDISQGAQISLESPELPFTFARSDVAPIYTEIGPKVRKISSLPLVTGDNQLFKSLSEQKHEVIFDELAIQNSGSEFKLEPASLSSTISNLHLNSEQMFSLTGSSTVKFDNLLITGSTLYSENVSFVNNGTVTLEFTKDRYPKLEIHGIYYEKGKKYVYVNLDQSFNATSEVDLICGPAVSCNDWTVKLNNNFNTTQAGYNNYTRDCKYDEETQITCLTLKLQPLQTAVADRICLAKDAQSCPSNFISASPDKIQDFIETGQNKLNIMIFDLGEAEIDLSKLSNASVSIISNQQTKVSLKDNSLLRDVIYELYLTNVTLDYHSESYITNLIMNQGSSLTTTMLETLHLENH